MKILYPSITAFLFAIVLFPFNTILAQNEIQPQIWFDNASYGTREMTCNPYSTGIISEQGPDYSKATITVTDPAANKYSTSIDQIAVHVWSDSDKKGIEITAYETEVNSGIFKGTVTISEGQSTQDAIHVTEGDTISAKYAGTTPWSLGTTGHGIITTAFIGMSCPPLERVPASAIQVTDNKGNEQKTITVDKQIQIRSNLTNVTIRNQTFAYIVQVQDKSGVTKSLSWISGVLLPSQALGPSVSWTPSKEGNYTVQVFVWQSLNNPNSLSPPVSTDLTVWPSLSDYARSTIKNAENFQCQSGYELVIKSNNNSTACVTSDTASKLVERGWGTFAASSIDDTGNREKNGTLSGIVSAYVYGGPISALSPNRSAHYEVDVYATDGITIAGKSISDAYAHYSLQLPAGNYIIYTYNDTKQTHLVSVYPGKNTVFNISSSIVVP
ncbi:MAG: hypothetical protein KGI27_00645 [Thaumarchaeota archaeon]|nr:hypothetical protein [Nitrososphaerota archaeon]